MSISNLLSMTSFLIVDLIDELLLWVDTWSDCSSNEAGETESEYWEQMKTDNKGIAMFAKKDIPAYTVIVLEKSILFEWKHKDSTTSIGQSLMNDFDALNASKQNIIMNLANVFADGEKENVIEAIYDTNACQTNASTVYTSGLFPIFSRLNHSCLSNCTMYFDAYPAEALIVKTLFDIAKGTELTVSYLPRFKNTYRQRQTMLSKRYKFECRCCLCADGEEIDDYIMEYKNSLDNIAGKHWNCAQTALDVLNEHFKSFPTVKADVLSLAINVAMDSYRYDAAYDAIVESIQLNMKCYGLQCKRWQELFEQISLLKSYSNDQRCDLLLKRYSFIHT